MADIHLDASGSNTAPYDTWAKAATSFATAGAAAAAGDRILMGSAYSESVASISLALAGTVASPVQLLSGTKGATSGLTALVAGAALIATGGTFTLTGSFYAYGITYRSSNSGSHAIQFGTTDGNVQLHDHCAFESTGVGGSTVLRLGNADSAGGSQIDLVACSIKMGAAGQLLQYQGMVTLRGGAWASGGTTPTALFRAPTGTRGSKLLVEGYDFSALGTGFKLHYTAQTGAVAMFRDILLPTSWTGAPIATADEKEGQRIELWNYKIGSTWYRHWVRDKRCDLTEENTLVRSGGASDTAGYAIKMVTTSACVWPLTAARSMDFAVGNSTTGSSLTVSVEILHDSATALNDDEVWLEVEEPDGTITTDMKADVLAAAAAQTTSSATWTTTGMSNPNKQTLSVAINASKAGRLLCRVYCSKASQTLYICPKVTVA